MRLLACLLCAAALAAADTPSLTRPGFANFTVSQRTIALNQPVRLEFTTLPRKVDGVEVATVVSQALDASRLAGHWRPIGEPRVTEDEKTHTITITFALLPRKVGELPLPRIPLTWVAADQLAEFGLVTVVPQIQVGSDGRDLPKEVSGVAGFLWGMRLEEARQRIPADRFKELPEVGMQATVQPGLDLIFREEALAEAVLTTPGLTLARARDSFIARWGAPLSETEDGITWILGWTRMEASPTDDGGTRLRLVREDIQSAIDRARVGRDIFGVLDGPGKESPEDAARRRDSDAQRELDRQIPAGTRNP